MQTIKIRFSRHVLIGAPCYFGSILYIHEVWRTPCHRAVRRRVSLHMPYCCYAGTRRVIKSLLGILSRFASHKSQTIFGSNFVGTYIRTSRFYETLRGGYCGGVRFETFILASRENVGLVHATMKSLSSEYTIHTQHSA